MICLSVRRGQTIGRLASLYITIRSNQNESNKMKNEQDYFDKRNDGGENAPNSIRSRTSVCPLASRGLLDKSWEVEQTGRKEMLHLHNSQQSYFHCSSFTDRISNISFFFSIYHHYIFLSVFSFLHQICFFFFLPSAIFSLIFCVCVWLCIGLLFRLSSAL